MSDSAILRKIQKSSGRQEQEELTSGPCEP
jgi:hypothetical protein